MRIRITSLLVALLCVRSAVGGHTFSEANYSVRPYDGDGSALGLLGNDILKRFHLIIDDRGGFAYFRPNARLREPFRNPEYYLVRCVALALVLAVAGGRPGWSAAASVGPHAREVTFMPADRHSSRQATRPTSRASRRRWFWLLGATSILAGALCWMLVMPGTSYRGPLPPVSEGEASLALELRAHVQKLAGEIGERNLFHYRELCRAADYIEAQLVVAGLRVRRQEFDVSGRSCFNLVGELPGGARREEIVLVGAHYDSVAGCPGANDNASGVAATLALAARLARKNPARTVRFVAFVNEEPPYFQTRHMGSWVCAKECRRDNANIVAMLSLETMGYYTDAPRSQSYPFPLSLFYPSTGNFLAFVGNLGSRSLLRQTLERFRRLAKFPSEGGALPAALPGVGWSDHWAFWQEGYPGIMLTDTAPFRYPHYHLETDTPDKIDYERLARVVMGLAAVLEEMAS